MSSTKETKTKIMKIKITDYSDELLEQLEKNIKKALKTCGQKAQDFAVENLTRNGSVKTGLLRNSIAYAIGGEAPTPKTYKADNAGEDAKGESYDETAPEDNGDVYTVYVGTNVEYALHVEAKKSYLAPALKEHTGVYRTIIKNKLEGK